MTQVNTDIAAFNNARTAQRTVFAEEDLLRTGRNTTRKELTRHLTQNLLVIAADMVDDSDRFNDYYDTSFLPRNSSGDADSGIFEGTVGAGTSANITSGIAPGTELLLTNTGAAKLIFCLASAAADVCMAGAELLPGASLTVTDADLGPIEGAFLNLTNADLVNGAYRVEVLH